LITHVTVNGTKYIVSANEVST